MKSLTQNMKHLRSLMSLAEKYGVKAASPKRTRAVISTSTRRKN